MCNKTDTDSWTDALQNIVLSQKKKVQTHQCKRHTIQSATLHYLMSSLEMVKADKSHMLGTTVVWRNSNDSV